MTKRPDDDVDALADELRAHKQGHQADLKGPLFQQGISTPEAFAGVKVETVERVVAPPTTAGAPRQTAPAEPASLAPSSGLSEPALRRVAPRPELLSPEPQGALFEVLTQIQHDLHELRSRIVAEPPKVVPQWLRAAAQNIAACDLPNPGREQTGVRVLPALQRQIERAQKRRGFRSRVGAWEWLLRLGLAVEERLPLDSGAS